MIENAQVQKRISMERWLVPVLIAAGMLLAIIFGVRAVHALANMRHAGFHPQPVSVDGIQDWMTVPGLARLFNVPEETLYQQLGVPQQGSQHSSLKTLNSRYFPDQPGWVLNRAKQALRQFQAQNLPRPGGAQ
jgi:hypothetical protein